MCTKRAGTRPPAGRRRACWPITSGSTLLDPGDLDRDPCAVPPQDPYSLRCAPQVLGTVADTLELARRWVEMDINAATDNPLIFLDLARDDKAVSGGNFHGEPMAMAMDFLAIALTDLASMSERRMFVLNDIPDTANREGAAGRFLIDEPAGTDGSQYRPDDAAGDRGRAGLRLQGPVRIRTASIRSRARAIRKTMSA